MSRTNRAAIAAFFSYSQSLVSMAFGLVVIKMILARVTHRDYGLWLASGEIIGYAGLLDVGVFSLLPWLIAKADGEGNRAAIRSHLKHAVVIGIAISAAMASLFVLFWFVLPLQLSPADRAVLRLPLFIVVGSVTVTYPLKVLDAVLIGLQDVKFVGAMSLTQMLTTSVIELAMLLSGFGLVSLAVSSALNVFIAGSFGLWRVRRIAPDLLRDWPPFRWATLAPIIGDGAGVWIGSLGVQLMAASAGIILAWLHEPELTPLYLVTSKLALIITQMCWMLPDSGLVGMAQLFGSENRDRVPGVVERMLQLHLLLSTTAACLILSFNPSFIRVWVGGANFAGFSFNTVSAVLIIAASLMHGLVCCTAVLGERKRIGVITIVTAVVQVVVALILTRWLGLIGLPLGALIGQTCVPAVFTLLSLRRQIGLDIRKLLENWLRTFGLQIIPLLTVAWFAGRFAYSRPIWQMAAIQIAMASIGVAVMWPLIRDLLQDPRVQAILSRFKARAG